MVKLQKKVDSNGFKLPKQWKHWCKGMKLSIHGKKLTSSVEEWFYLRGRGHYWRVNCHAVFQCGDTYEEFDRWARCDIEEVPLPQTRAEFNQAVRMLLERKHTKTPDNSD